MGISEAVRCRQVRIALLKPNNTTPQESQESEEPGSPGSYSEHASPSPGRGGAMAGASLSGDGAMLKHLLFAPPGTTPAEDFPQTLEGVSSDDHACEQHENAGTGSSVPVLRGGSRSLDGSLFSTKTGGKGSLDSSKPGGFGLGMRFLGRSITAPAPGITFLGRSLSTPERTIGAVPSAVAAAPSQTVSSPRDREEVGDVEEGFSVMPSYPRASKGGAREEAVLREAGELASDCGEENSLNTRQEEEGSNTQQSYGSVEEKEKGRPKAKGHRWGMGASQLARLRNKFGGEDQAYGAIAEEEDHDDVGEEGGGEWRQRVSKWYGNR